MVEKKVTFVAETDEAEDNVAQLIDSIKELSSQVEKSNETMKKTYDGVAEGSKKAEKGVGGFSKSIKGIGTALKAAGIGLFIAAIGGLFSLLSKNQKVIDGLNTAMTTVQLVFNAVTEAIGNAYTKVSEATGGFDNLKAVVIGLLTLAITPLKLQFYAIKLVIQEAQLAWEQSFFGDKDPATIAALTEKIELTKDSLQEVTDKAIDAGSSVIDNFSGAIDEVGSLTTAVVEEVTKVSEAGLSSFIDQAEAITQLRNTAEIAIAQNKKLYEEYDRQAERQRQVRDNESIAITERLIANEELAKVLNEQEQLMIKNADLLVAQAQANLSLNNTVENRAALIDAEAEKAGILASIEGKRSEQMTNQVTLLEEQATLQQTIIDGDAERAQSARDFAAEQIDDPVARALKLQENLEVEREAELNRLQLIIDGATAGTQARVDAEQEYLNSQQEFDQRSINLAKKTSEAKKKINDAEASAKIKTLSAVSAAASAAADLAGEETVAGKTLAIAASLINTYLGITASLKIGGFAGIAQAVAVGITGFAAVKNIVATKVPGESGGGGGSVGNVQPATPSYNVAGSSPATTSDVQGNTEALEESTTNPTPAYLIASEVNSTLALNREISENSGL